MQTQIDHLVIAANTLEQGVQWCEERLGITPGAGGEHVLFGTHNRLFKIATPKFPMAYFEIIAINPDAVRPKKTVTLHPHRWFDLDKPELQKAIATEPRLIHFVASTPDIKAARMALRMEGIDRGPAIHAERQTNKGLLHWQISVRADGQRLFDGALPTLIQWASQMLLIRFGCIRATHYRDLALLCKASASRILVLTNCKRHMHLLALTA